MQPRFRLALAGLLLFVLLLLALSAPMPAMAAASESGSATDLAAAAVNLDVTFTYTVDSSGDATITGYTLKDGVTQVNIPETIDGHRVGAVANGVFSGDTRITKVVFPPTVVRLGDHLFEYCTKLTYADLTAVEELAVIPTSCFQGCTSLESVDIPASVVTIMDAAFIDCTSLKQVNIPPASNLDRIGIYAFGNCVSLESVELPASLRSIGLYAFYNCKSVASIWFRGSGISLINMHAFDGCAALEELYLPDHVGSINDKAFANCTSLKVVAFGKALPQTQKSDVFKGCNALELMLFPTHDAGVDPSESDMKYAGWTKDMAYMTYYVTGSHDDVAISHIVPSSKHRAVTVPAKIGYRSIKRIDAEAAHNRKLLTEVRFPSDSEINHIGCEAFARCTALKTIEIPASVNSLDSRTFMGCTALSSVSFKTVSLGTIKSEAFSGCTSLTEITIPEGVDTIENQAFYNCLKLETVNLPDSLTSLGANAFDCGKGKKMAIKTMRMPNSNGDLNTPSDRDFFESWIVNQARDTFKFQVTYGSTADFVWFEPHILGDPKLYPITLPADDREYVPVEIGDRATHTKEANDVKLTWSTVENWTGEQIIPEVTATRWWRTDPVGDGDGNLTVEPMLGYDCTSVGKQKIVVTGNAPYFTGYRILEYEIVKSNMDDVQMTDISPDCVWDNQKWYPDPGFYVELGAYDFLQDAPDNSGHIYNLIKDVDYTIAGYDHNKMAGEKATITIEGKGNFQGKKTLPFTIYPADLANTQVKVPDQVYTGEAVTPVPSEVMLLDRRGGDHYTVELDLDTDYKVDPEGYQNNTEAGTATLTLFPEDGCTWLTSSEEGVKVNFNIVQADLSEATVEAVPDQTYTGADITPALKVSSGEGELVQDRDYTVSWENNRNVGTAKATLKAKSAGCTGEQTITFEIVPKPVTVTPYDAIKTYGDSDPVLTAAVEGTVGSDLVVYTLARELGENVGDYTITASGLASQGNYTVTFAQGTFTIERASIGDATIEDVDAVFFDGAAQEPKPAVTWNGKTLAEDKDYLLSYADNVNAGRATIIVQGVGNFKDEMRPKFTVLPLDLRRDGCQVFVGFQAHTGQPLTPHPTRVTASGRDGVVLELVEGTDYMVYDGAWLDNVDVGTGYVKVSGIGNFCESREGSFNIVNDGDLSQGYMDDILDQVYTGGPIEPKLHVYLKGVDLWLERGVDYTSTFADNVDVGTAKVTVTGTGGLHGSLDASFDILPADFSSAVVAVPDQVYNGAPLEPSPSVTWNEMLLEEGRDYEVSAYADNVRVGTASVTVTGKGNFEGTASGTFEIAKRSATITVDSASKVRGEADPVFTGTVDGLIDAGDLGKVEYFRTNGDEASGTYEGVLDAEYTANADYDVSVVKGDFTIEPGYSVRFDANVPANASTTSSGSMDDQRFACDERKALSNSEYFLPGYDFEGWNTKADGTGTAYRDGAEVENLSEDGDTVVLYAQWSGKPYTIEYWSDDAGSQKHVQTAYFDRPGKLDQYSDSAFGWDSGGRTLHGWSGRGFGSFYEDGDDFCNLCGAPDVDGNVGDAVIIADWVYNGQIVVTVTRDGVPQEGLEDYLVLVQGDATFSVPIHYEHGRYVFDPSQASAPGSGPAQLPEGDYMLRFAASGYPETAAYINYRKERAAIAVLDFYTVSVTKDPVYADFNDVQIGDSSAVAPRPGMVLVPDGAMLNIKTHVAEGYRFDGYTAVGVAPAWDPDPSVADQTIEVRGHVDIAAHVSPIEYAVTVEGGTADKATAHVGETVTVTADAPEPGKAFVQWAHADGVDFADASSTSTTFAMPAKDVTATAVVAPIVIAGLNEQGYQYTGEPIAPDVVVSLDGVDLVLTAEDYEVSFEGNVNAGDAKVAVTMKGPRAGSAASTFKITPRQATITVESASKVQGEADPAFAGTVEGLVADGDLGEVSYKRTNDEEAPGTYEGVLTATYTANPNYDVTVVNGDFTIKKLLTVTWLDGDGSVLQTKTYAEGDEPPAYDGKEPTKAATAQYTYSFTGWDGGTVDDATTTYRPLFSETVNEYTVRFVDDDGTELQSGKVAYGRTPEYEGKTPEKAPTAQYSYEFAGWTPEVAPVTGDAVYTATYSSTLNKYKVSFVDDDGTVLQSGRVPYGQTPEYTGEAPEKPTTAQYSYEFAGWTPGVAPVTGDATYTATYEETVNEYTVRFVNDDGAVLQGGKVAYGQTPEYEGKAPEKAPTAQHAYSFKGWTPEIAAVTGDATYMATYAEAAREYTVRFVNDDGAVLQSARVPYGQTPQYEGKAPEKPATAQYSYEFAGWTPEVAAVTGDAVYTATYSSTLNRYKVTFVDYDGSTVLKEAAEYGYGTPAADVERPADPAREPDAQYSYTFAGWTPEVADVTADVVYTAVYESGKRSYEVTWLQDDGSLIDRTAVEYGERPAHADPAKAPTAQYTYTFKGWTPEVAPVTGDATYTATYEEAVNEYTVEFVNDDGTVLQSGQVAYGQTPQYEGETPEKAPTARHAYTFKGWSPKVAPVTGDATYTATYAEAAKRGTLTFDCGGGTIDGRASLSIEANVGDTVTIPEAPVRDGYTFKYWKGSEYHPGDKYTVEGDHTFTAVWEKNPNNGGGSSGGGSNGGGSNAKGASSPSTGDISGVAVTVFAITAACALCLAAFALYQRRRRSSGRLDKHERR